MAALLAIVLMFHFVDLTNANEGTDEYETVYSVDHMDAEGHMHSHDYHDDHDHGRCKTPSVVKRLRVFLSSRSESISRQPVTDFWVALP